MKAFNDYLKTIIHNGVLSEADITASFNQLLTVCPAQQASYLTAMATRGETESELLHLLNALKCYSNTITSSIDCIDIVGTGGDGLKTFNISTASSLVVASCGIAVAKHGGRAVTSNTGSADVAYQLKLPIYNEAHKIKQDLQQFNFTYLCAPFFNTFLEKIAELRRSMGIFSFLNILAPLVNPLSVKRQVVGVYHTSLQEKVAQLLFKTGSIHAMVVCSDEGMDEFSLSSITHVLHIKDKTITRLKISAAALGLEPAPINAIQGGTAAENAKLIESIFQGTIKGPCLDIVLLNAAAGLMVADKAEDLKTGINMAREAIESGKTIHLLEQLRGQHV